MQESFEETKTMEPSIKVFDPNFKDFEPSPLNEYEKNMLKGTLTPEELLEKEREELSLRQQEANDELYRKNRRMMIQIICMSKIGKSILINPRYLKDDERLKFYEYVSEYLNMDNLTDERIQKDFNIVCNQMLFTQSFDYSTIQPRPIV